MNKSSLQTMSRKELIALLESARAGKLPVPTMYTIYPDGQITRNRSGKRTTVTAETLLQQYNRENDWLLCMQDAELPYIANPGLIVGDCDPETVEQMQILFDRDTTSKISFYD